MTQMPDDQKRDQHPEPNRPEDLQPDAPHDADDAIEADDSERPTDPTEPMEPTPAPDDRSARGAAKRRRLGKPGALPVAAQTLLQSLENPWLLAAWPGMGGVAAIAAGHIAQTIGATPVGMLSLAEHFPLDGVDVQHGIARANPIPRCLLLAWKDPQRKRDLLLILGEAQPPSGGADVCRKIMDMAQARGVTRILTFAAMGSQIDPREDPRVFGATTAPEMLDDFTDASIDRLSQGKVTGLNGALLAVAAERGIPAACLLGEMPIFAAGMPNPRASLEVVNAFNRITDLDINVDLLIERAAEMQPQLDAMHEQIQRLGQGDTSDFDDVDEDSEPNEESSPESSTDTPKGRRPSPPAGSPSDAGSSRSTGGGSGRPSDRSSGSDGPRNASRPSGTRNATPRVDEHAREHIERLFRMAESDREEAQRLKDELDRLGVFGEYEDRFLDLFRRPS